MCLKQIPRITSQNILVSLGTGASDLRKAHLEGGTQGLECVAFVFEPD